MPCTWTERAALGADPLAPNIGLGSAIALDGRSIIVGASAYPNSPGSAYVYSSDGATWSQTDRLTGGGTDLDSFGKSMAVSADWLILGAPTTGRTTHAQAIGSAFFFERNGSSWVKRQLVEANSLSSFGESVALSGALAAVAGTNPVSVFRQEGAEWIEDGTISVPGSRTVVAASGDTFAVGVPDDRERGESAGAVHVFRRQGSMPSTYEHEAKLLGSNIAARSQFGDSMALEGDVLAIGTSLDATVYVFERTGNQWTQTSALSSPHPELKDLFGHSIALDGTRLVVGALKTPPYPAGTLYVYERTGETWEYRSEVRSSRPTDGLGASVAIRGNLLVAGASQDDVGATNTGSAIVWECLAP